MASGIFELLFPAIATLIVAGGAIIGMALIRRDERRKEGGSEKDAQ